MSDVPIPGSAIVRDEGSSAVRERGCTRPPSYLSCLSFPTCMRGEQKTQLRGLWQGRNEGMFAKKLEQCLGLGKRSIITIPTLERRNQGLQRSCDLPKVTQPVHGGDRIQAQISLSHPARPHRGRGFQLAPERKELTDGYHAHRFPCPQLWRVQQNQGSPRVLGLGNADTQPNASCCLYSMLTQLSQCAGAVPSTLCVLTQFL